MWSTSPRLNLAEIALADASPGFRMRHPNAAASSDADTRGAVLGQVAVLAEELGCMLAPLIGGGGFSLSGPFGEATYQSLGHVLAALRARAFKPAAPAVSSRHQPPPGPRPPRSVAQNALRELS